MREKAMGGGRVGRETLRKLDGPPEGSILLQGLHGPVDYMDSYAVDIPCNHSESIDVLATRLFATRPLWAMRLMAVRDAIVRPLGLKTDKADRKTSAPSPDGRYAPGDLLVLFHVLFRTDREIVLAEDDRHLYFRVSVHSEAHADAGTRSITLSTAVQFHNLWGRVYFAPVKPFHQLVARAFLEMFAEGVVEVRKG